MHPGLLHKLFVLAAEARGEWTKRQAPRLVDSDHPAVLYSESSVSIRAGVVKEEEPGRRSPARAVFYRLIEISLNDYRGVYIQVLAYVAVLNYELSTEILPRAIT